jgi:hypothetical protein
MEPKPKRVPISKFSIILPCVQIPVAVALWEWGRYQPRAHGFGSWPTAGLICYGINAPAIFSRMVIYPIRMATPPRLLARYSVEELAFFAAVGVVWFLVGLAIDRKLRDMGRQRPVTVATVLRDLILVLMGIVLFWQGLRGFSMPWHEGNYWGSFIKNALFVVWSVAFVGIPILRLAMRRATTAATVS